MSRKQAKRAAIRAQKAEDAAREHALNWTARDGKDRPTPERVAKGRFALRDTEDAGVSVAVDEAGTVLDRLHIAGEITVDQLQAGHDLAAVLHRTSLAPAGRSCLDVSPKGFDSLDAEETHQQRRDREQRQQIWLRCKGPWVWPELSRVCGHDEAPRHIASLRAGLDICAQVFGR